MLIRRALILGLVVALLVGCGAFGTSGTSARTPTAVPPPTARRTRITSTATPAATTAAPITATATPTPSQTPVSITYRLTKGSTILSSAALSGSSGPVLEEPLSGTFTVLVLPRESGPDCFNTIFCFAVTDLQFQSVEFAVQGSSGLIRRLTIFGETDRVFFDNFSSSINGQTIVLSGNGPFGADAGYPPIFSGVEICGLPPGVGGSCAGIRAGSDVGYDVMIFATPVVTTAP